MKTRLFWISWHQPTEDYRPLSFPPSESVSGWWCSGVRGSDDAAILVAIVGAEDEDAAKTAIKKNWPEADEWRFVEEIPDKGVGGRFPPSDWMIERGVFHRQALQDGASDEVTR